MFKKLEIKPGDKYNKLTIIKEDGRFYQPSGQTQRAFLCRCDCGNISRVRLSHLITGRVSSCGCNFGERHGDSGSFLHTIWRGMKNRVKEYHSQRHLYYDRGITCCEEWNIYSEFKKWAIKNGFKPGLQIDRINNNGNYCPENCRFVDVFTNANNRRITIRVSYEGKTVPLRDILRKQGKSSHFDAIDSRIRRGWDHEKAINTPIRKIHKSIDN